MKINKNILLIIAIMLPVSLLGQSKYTNKGTGKINNAGLIKVKNNTLTNEAGGTINNSADAEIEVENNAAMSSDGIINNDGLIESFGLLSRIAQPSINGTVIIDNEIDYRNVPQISYNNILLR